jgi:hypothetical protein
VFGEPQNEMIVLIVKALLHNTLGNILLWGVHHTHKMFAECILNILSSMWNVFVEYVLQYVASMPFKHVEVFHSTTILSLDYYIPSLNHYTC